MYNQISLTIGGTLLASAVLLAGCGSPGTPDTHADDDGHDHDHAVAAVHDHSGWWCDEHGVPEEVCTRCNASLIPEFKEKDDWCAEHNRPESQCFLCSPELKERFAARYRAKFGEDPPALTDP